MIRQMEHLNPNEQRLLLSAPVLVSVLASCSLNTVNEYKKADAIKLSHIKTFTADPLLLPYYAEVEKNFKNEFETALRKYYPFDAEKRKELEQEIGRVRVLMSGLEPKYANVLRGSLERYAKHVAHAHSVIRDFVLPIPIPGLTD